MGIRFSVCGWKLFHLTTAESGGRKRKLEGAPELIRVLPFLPDINNANGHVSTSVCRRPKRASFISTIANNCVNGHRGVCQRPKRASFISTLDLL